MRPKILSTAAITEDLDGVVTAQALTAATPMTLQAAAAALSPPRRLVFDSNGDVSSVVFTIVGTNRYGHALTATVTGVTTTAVTSTAVFASVTSITPSGSSAQTVTVGWTAESISPPLVLDGYANPFNVGLGLVVSGTVNSTVQHTFDNLLAPGTHENDVTWFDHDSIAGATANADGNYAFGIYAVRLVQNSGSGSSSLRVIQSGY